jgi:phenylacetic acid degradation operon negative regulatory protein
MAAAADVLAAEPSARADLLVARSLDADEDRQRAARRWNLDELARDYATFVRRWGRRIGAPRNGRISPCDALIRRTQIVHEYRMFLFRDPDLPEELLPAAWPGPAAHALVLEALELLRDHAMSYYRKIIHADDSASDRPAESPVAR